MAAEQSLKNSWWKILKLHNGKDIILEIYFDGNEELQGLLEDFLVDYINYQRSDFLHFLARSQSPRELELLQKLLLKEANYLQVNLLNELPLHCAIKLDNVNAINVLLKHEASLPYMNINNSQIYALDYKDDSPLSLAKQKSDASILNLLKKHKQQLLFDPEHSLFSIPPREMPIYGNVNWVNVTQSEPEFAWLANPTGQIVETNADGTIVNRFCSGFNIGKNLFLTAGHCIEGICQIIARNFRENTNQYRVSFNYEYSLEGNKYIQENAYKIIGEYAHGSCVIADKNKEVDFAIFELENAAEKLFGKVNLTVIPPFNVQTPIAIAHHPDGLPKKISQGVYQGTNPDAINYENRQLDSNAAAFYTAPTFGGSSGAPIANLDRKRVFAIHVADDRKLQSNHIGLTLNEVSKQNLKVRKLFTTFGLFEMSPSRRERIPSSDAASASSDTSTSSLSSASSRRPGRTFTYPLSSVSSDTSTTSSHQRPRTRPY